VSHRAMVSEKYRSKFSHRKTQSTMALDQSALLELLGELKLTDVTDRIRVATETLYQELIDAEAAAFIGAAPFERSPDRVAQRNGTRPRTLTTTAGDLELRSTACGLLLLEWSSPSTHCLNYRSLAAWASTSSL
jgi:hypothetical protein